MNLDRLKTVFFISLLATLLLSCMPTRPQKPQHPKQLSCIPDKLFRCEPDAKKCMMIPILNDFGVVEIAIDLAGRKLSSYSDNKPLTKSDIDSVQNINGLLYLSGKGYGYDKAYRSWTAIINLEDGRLYSTSITTGAGHIIYGKCYDKSK